ncbi:hypothetical protein AJ88_18555 [Mesorhizobium amorphae CCBAU 01583]|nr:hypothetical protein AJ88_18555 [Mesorhizobium amorphae CCBAU 01583]
MSLLEIENLSLAIGDTPILKGVELSVAPGEVMGLVGESGSGKSMTALTVMQLLPFAARATGRVTFDGIDILAASEDQMCALRGDDIGMVFQEPMTALNPVKTIGEQVAEGIRWHTRSSRAEAEDRAQKCSTGSACRQHYSRCRAIRMSCPVANASASSSPSPVR